MLRWSGDPAEDALALRVAGALNALVLGEFSADLTDVYPPRPRVDDDQLWQAIAGAMQSHDGAIRRFMASPPQTNEVGRSAALAAGFLTIAALTSAQTAMLEVGASAGLNLHWDQFGYELGGLAAGKATGRPFLKPAWEGPPPPAAEVVIHERAGCDRTPIDARSPEDTLRLRAYVWPDQPERLSRMDQALDVARTSSVPVERADAADWVEARLTERRTGVTTILFHSIVWQYIERQGQERIERALAEAGNRAGVEAPVAWLRMEPATTEAAALQLTLWPGGKTTLLADVDYHGRWVRWHIDAASLQRLHCH